MQEVRVTELLVDEDQLGLCNDQEMVEPQYVLYIFCIELLYLGRDHWNYGHLDILTLNEWRRTRSYGSCHMIVHWSMQD
jgi:hypothetical protein